MASESHVTHIIHISDLHIRTGDSTKSRYDEYSIVFDNLYRDLAVYEPIQQHQALIVIAGDLFHHKLKIESPGLKLILNLLKKLASLADVIIIKGNHDYRQDSPSEPDLVESVLSVKVDGVYYINNTGHHIHKNIGFGVVAIQDALLSGNTSGINPTLPRFPPVEYFDDFPHVQHKIALFHGTVSNTTLQNGRVISNVGHNSYPLEWFKGYDLKILGDIHLQQVHDADPLTEPPSFNFKYSKCMEQYKWEKQKNKPWAYSGSLIQQDYGETLLGHGFLVWDLRTRVVSCFHVKNDCGFITLRETAPTKLEISLKNTWIDLDTIIAESWFPQNVCVRLIRDTKTISSKDMDIFKTIPMYFKQFDINVTELKPHFANKKTNITLIETNDVSEEHEDITSFNTPQAWMEYISHNCNGVSFVPNWTEWFHHFDTIKLPNSAMDNKKIQDMIHDKNTKIQKHASMAFDSLSYVNNTKHKFFIKQIDWDYILCFKDNNYFNFENNKHSINSISAPNACGKTNFLETICIAIYGKGIPSRTNSVFSSAFISYEKPKNASSQTSIMLDIQGQIYRIKRTFQKRANDESKIYSQSRDNTLDKLDEKTNIFVNIKSGNFDEWIHTHIGTMNAFLTSCMVSQNSDMDFFEQSSSDQKQMLDNALHINSSSLFLELLKESKNAHETVFKAVSVAIEALQHQNAKLNDPMEDITRLQESLWLKLHMKEEIMSKYDVVHRKYRVLPNNILSFDKTELINAISSFDKELYQIMLDEIVEIYNIHDVTTEIATLKSELNSLGVEADLLLQEHNIKSAKDSLKVLETKKTDLDKLVSDLYPQDEIKIMERQYQDWNAVMNTRYLNTSNLGSVLDSYQIQIMDNERTLDQNKTELESIKSKYDVVKHELSRLYDSQPLQVRIVAPDQYLSWIASIQRLETQYTSLALLSDYYDSLDCGKPSSNLEEVSLRYTTHDLDHYVSTIDIVNIHAQSCHMITTLEHELEQIKDRLMLSNNHQPIKTNWRATEYEEWKLKRESIGINAVVSPDQPHTSKCKLMLDLESLSMSYNPTDEFDLTSIKDEIQINKKTLEDANTKLLVLLATKPNNPSGKFSSTSYDIHKKQLLNMILDSTDLDKIQEAIKLLQDFKGLHLNLDHHQSILTSLHDHEYNPECWSCQKNPINLQKINISKAIKEIELELKPLQKKLLKLGLGKKYTKNIDKTIVNVESHRDLLLIIKSEERDKAELEALSQWTQECNDVRDVIHKLKDESVSLEDSKKRIETNIAIRDLKQMIEAWNAYEAYTIIQATDYWTEELQRHTEYEDWKCEHDKLQTSFDSMSQTLEHEKQQCKKYEEALEDMSCIREYNKWTRYNDSLLIKTDLDLWTKLQQEEEFWLEEERRKENLQQWKASIAFQEQKMNTLTSLREDLETYNTNLICSINESKVQVDEISKHIKELTTWTNILDKIQRDKVVYQEMADVKGEIDMYDKIIKSLEIHDDIKYFQDTLKALQRYNEISEVYKSYKQYLEIYDEWFVVSEEFESITTLDDEISQLKIDLSLLKQQQVEAWAHMKTMQTYTEYLDLISSRNQTLNMLYDTFGKYSTWLYSEKVIPYIINAANLVILEMSAHRPLLLQCQITHKTSGTTFNWFLQDGSSNPPIQKASGFQRFISGLAIRIALGKIGASGIKPSQLFLDEGFTSCDADNISHVGSFLNTLLDHFYDQIIIVSHLHDVSVCAHNKIVIQRNPFEKYSTLQYGVRADVGDRVRTRGGSKH